MKNHRTMRDRLANDTRLAAALTAAFQQMARELAELDDLDPQEWHQLKTDAAHGRAMSMGRRSDVTDAELQAAMREVEHDFRGLKRREQYGRAGLIVGLSAAQVQRRLLRLRKAHGTSGQ